jgi:hypothetical protein
VQVAARKIMIEKKYDDLTSSKIAQVLKIFFHGWHITALYTRNDTDVVPWCFGTQIAYTAILPL